MLEQILERVGFDVLSEMLLFGSIPEEQAILGASYEARLKAAEVRLSEQLEGLHLESELDEDIQEAVYLLQAKVSPIYFELGMKAGVALYRSLQDELSTEVHMEG